MIITASKSVSELSAVKSEYFNPRYYTLNRLPETSHWLIAHKLKEFLSDYGIKDYPINSFQLAKKIQDAGKILVDILVEHNLSSGVDAVAVYLPECSQYLIIVNGKKTRSLRTSKDRRCNFTMAHEIGHIVLGHLLIPKKYKSKERLALEEEEANLFAAQLLIPEKLLLKSSFHSPEAVATEFLVSDQCLWVRVNNLKRLDLFKSIPKPVCSICGNADISPAAGYCIICGTSLSDKQKKGVKVIEYYTPPADTHQRTMFCEECGNEEFSVNAEFCRICGLPLYNKCWGNNDIIGCGHANLLHARYCEICGAPTAYSSYNRFREWMTERDDYIMAVTQR